MRENAFSATVDGSVLTVEVHTIDTEDGAVFDQRLRELIGRRSVTGFVAVDDTDGPIPSERFDAIDRIATFAARSGIERIALVGEGVKTIAVEGTVDHPGLEVERFQDRTAARTWVERSERTA